MKERKWQLTMAATVRRKVEGFGELVVESSERGLTMVTIEGFRPKGGSAGLKSASTVEDAGLRIREVKSGELTRILNGKGPQGPGSRLDPKQAALEAADMIAAALGGDKDSWDRLGSLPVDPDALGKGFNAKVLGILRAVPAGCYITYGELAEAAGSPGAARAVGAAMASNRLLIVVPCHRVYGAGGRFTGFGGGLGMKAALAAAEQQN
ncbi:MAG TPA: methylated-DNA--[protein]-cysteine S-methyltransferase [Bacillota bacterium]|nr:methylated-DNA--[protein]-cysteine S-methyltransferase [Bacillota bacterium]